MAFARRTSKQLFPRPLLGLGLGALLALASCTKDKPGAGSDPGSTTMPPPPGANPSASPGVTASPPSATPPSADQAGDSVSGTVVETMNSGGYTYARLEDGGKQVWVAGPETPLTVGTKIGKVSGMVMSGFKSTTLNRTFDQIYFIGSFDVAGATAGAPAGSAPATSGMANPHGPATAGSAMPNPHGAAAPAAAAAGEKIEPAAGGKTVAEIFAGKDALAGKPVVVRGKVVKVNNGILGRNWVHLQDGTGAPGTNDLMVTTSATVTRGDVVVARGNLATNKDFGAGYSYPVLVEDARIDSK
ncbi:MAG TPA: hypothetical protein VFK02_17825 [Kofleriaceae bacterium]|nr:hypothetical protein [Kofleriaceae bacterium]